MKIAVYTITKNEEKFIEKWYESAKEADYLVILDTGSTDKTVRIARDLGISIYEDHISPWRFDVARNKSLSLVPDDADICIALDADEVLLPGWRDHLEKINPDTTRPRYKYVWSWKTGGEEGLVYGGDKIHRRHGYVWKHPVHEVLWTESEVQEWIGLEIHHHPDPTKSRSQYLPLLKLSTEEDPDDDRNAHYYGRELMFNGMLEDAAKELRRHLSLPRAQWKPERAASMMYLSKCEPENTEYWLKMACDETPWRREPLVSTALYYYLNSDFENTIIYAEKALEIKEKPLDYLCEEYAWGSIPHDILAISAYRLGDKEKAMRHGIKAFLLEQNNDRLLGNLAHYASV